ncbi:MAG: zinc-binding dehydrogenase [Gammaproteobacteria bacterium]|nr:zinc-binding dehydrogenase [Gammaproteobacteria bacterium]
MRAVVLTGHGGPDKLEYHADWPAPQPGPGEAVVKVGACGLNNTDVNTRSAWYSKGAAAATSGGELEGAGEQDAAWGGGGIEFPRIQGADVAGVVVATGAAVDEGLIGQRVLIDTWLRDWNEPMNMDKCAYYGSECDGGYADYTCVDARQVHPVASALSDTELATFATAYVTAENMLNRAAVGAGQTVLIPGASGGVGSALIQLTKRRGAVPIAMCGAGKEDAVRAAGAQIILPRSRHHTGGDLGGALRASIARDTVDVVADVVGGDGWPALIGVIARGGRYTCAGAIAGPVVDFDLRTFYLRDLTFTGATIVPPGVFADLVRYIERGEIKPLLAATFALRDFHAAQQAFIDKRHVGNIVIDMAL